MIGWVAAPDDVLALRCAGQMSRAEVEEVFRIARERLERHGEIGIWVDATGFEGFTLDGLAQELRELPAGFGLRDRVRRKAVVTDSALMTAWVGLLGTFGQRPEYRALPSAEAEAALQWAAARA
jgi:hypothetical protein